MKLRENPRFDFASELNPAQRAVVEATTGAQLVIAGPGSGKTRTLVYRVAHLVLSGVPPESILLLTFTRKAAEEMLRRASRLLDERCRAVAGGTFHAFANQVLRKYAALVGYKDGFTILDRSDAGDLVGVLRTEGGYDEGGRRFPHKGTIVDLFSKHANTRLSLEEILLAEHPHFIDELPALTELEARFGARKRAMNVVDYDDLLILLRQLLVEQAAVRARLSATYRYVMVDEYQDTNHLQAHIAALVASGHGNLMVVGDDAQSIYAFRGASFKNIFDFPKIFPDTRTTLLEQNYRSTQPILDLANAVLARATEKFEKNLFTEVPGKDKPLLVHAADEFSQAAFVRQRVLELREEGVPLQEIAVLTRAAWHSNTLEVELANANIPFRKFGGLKFVEAAHVKDLAAILKLALNPLDTAAWFRVLQLFEGVGPKTAQGIAQAVAIAGGRFAVLAEPRFAARKYGEELARLGKLLLALSDESPSVAERVAVATAYYRPLVARRFDDAPRRLRDLEAFEDIAQRYRSLERFLTDVALDPPELTDQDEADAEDEWMTVSTVHSAKGLEWHTVFILNLVSGHFPSNRSLGEVAGLDEERRLFYVAVTRAKRNLYLLAPQELPRRGPTTGAMAELSELLTEIPDLEALTDEANAFVEPAADPWASPRPAGGADLMARIQGFFGND